VTHRSIATILFGTTILLMPLSSAAAEMGPCVPTGKDAYTSEDLLACGAGEGAALVISRSTSPSKRLALAWRLANRAPSVRPDEHDPDLENLIVRIKDGAVLARTHGVYWHTGDRTAKANNIASWSPDSRLLIAGMEDVDSETVELFAIAPDDSVTGPFDLVKVLEPATRAQMKAGNDGKKYSFRITYMPGITIDDQGLIRASVYLAEQESGEGPIYDLTAKANRTTELIDVKVLSISQYLGPRISVTVH
jgi:hypothetical protein